ncbi:GCS2 [Symbiodinium pilosum]|uniref:Mannosyl-oligosaccharide glucosidase n=1 Tax=Symbiodinium pilosum TaxID=2952 RepID=A0A812J7X5_SYMPI|nr:GCS2 [Symbiodinium pilosum]
MTWGTYRPGVYFGIKGRHAGSFLLGLAWGSLDGKILRHECESGELQAFNWHEHDGRNFGRQIIEDQKLQAQLDTTFVKEDARKWHVRVGAASLPPFNSSDRSKSKAISLFLYLGVEAGKHGVELKSYDPEWQACGEFWCRSLVLAGTDPSQGSFEAKLSFRASGSRKPRWHRAAARVAHELDASTEDPVLTGVWDARKHIHQLSKKVAVNSSKTSKTVLVLADKDASDSNFQAFQLAGYPSAGLRIDAHVAFGSSFGSRNESLVLNDLAEKGSQSFKQRLSEVFGPQANSSEGVAMAVSGLLGGLGSFRGRLLARRREGTSERLERLPAAELFTAVPSRAFFPRGFLWDEGFHGLLLSRWHPRMFLEILAHWLELQQESGWIPREVPLGAEQERRVPKQFLPQDPEVANPPSFLLPLAQLVNQVLSKTEPLAEELRGLVLSFGAAALPRLGAWFAFLERSQKSAHPSGCYRWRGRTAAHCLASGLDDYPRGLLVNEDECHLDLHSWMTLFARTLAKLCEQLRSRNVLSKEEDETFCTRPAWTQRAQRLNESLFQVFEDPQASGTAPLADFLSSQLLEKGRVRVLPPWRSDGRCGPQFPVAKKPGECDPYGGAPCCSPSGWCGGSPDFCDCPGCRRSKKLEERSLQQEMAKVHSPHLGYVSLFPLLLGLQPCDHPRAQSLLRALQPKGELWSPYGVMSLSSKDKLFRQGEDYWRGKIWANLNYLTLSALQRCPLPEAKVAFDSLKKGFAEAVLGALQRQQYLMENFDPKTGEGRGAAPFAGWTTLVALVLADMPLEPSFDLLASDQKLDL